MQTKLTKIIMLFFIMGSFSIFCGCNSGGQTNNIANKSNASFSSGLINKNDFRYNGMDGPKNIPVAGGFFRICGNNACNLSFTRNGVNGENFPLGEITPVVVAAWSDENYILLIDDRGLLWGVHYDLEDGQGFQLISLSQGRILPEGVSPSALALGENEYIVIDNRGIAYAGVKAGDGFSPPQQINALRDYIIKDVIYNPRIGRFIVLAQLRDHPDSMPILISLQNQEIFRQMELDAAYNAIALDNDQVIVMPNGRPSSSTSGLTNFLVYNPDTNEFRNVVLNMTQNINGFASGNKITLGVGETGGIIRLKNGESQWEILKESSPDVDGFNNISYSNGIFLINGLRNGYPVSLTTENGNVLTSTIIPPLNTISAGSDFACGINKEELPNSARVMCWGSNEAGQLGYGGLEGVLLPKDVMLRKGGADVRFQSLTSGVNLVKDDVDLVFQSVVAGGKHACGSTIDNVLYCWGNNQFGQLGNGASSDFIPNPSYAVTGKLFMNYDLGRNHTCGVSTDKNVWCWGSNEFGQLGNGESRLKQSEVPVQVLSSEKFRSVSITRNTSCGISINNEGYCWGDNSRGQLGNGKLGGVSYIPIKLSNGSSDWVYLSSGTGKHICGIDTYDNLYCWGNNDKGQIGNGSESVIPVRVPEHISFRRQFVQVTTGLDHTCARDNDGYVYCWGSNQYGQLGIDKSVYKPTVPVAINGRYSTWSSISAGDYFTCGVSQGKSYCWGRNNQGQLGANSRFDESRPVWINSYVESR